MREETKHELNIFIIVSHVLKHEYKMYL